MVSLLVKNAPEKSPILTAKAPMLQRLSGFHQRLKKRLCRRCEDVFAYWGSAGPQDVRGLEVSPGFIIGVPLKFRHKAPCNVFVWSYDLRLLSASVVHKVGFWSAKAQPATSRPQPHVNPTNFS